MLSRTSTGHLCAERGAAADALQHGGRAQSQTIGFSAVKHLRCQMTVGGMELEESATLLREVGARRGRACVQGNLEHVCLHLGDLERAQGLSAESMAPPQAQQMGLAWPDCLWALCGDRYRQRRVTSAWPATRVEYTHFLSLAPSRLTDAEFQTEEAAGRALSLEQATDYALHLSRKASSPLTVRTKPDDLAEQELA